MPRLPIFIKAICFVDAVRRLAYCWEFLYLNKTIRKQLGVFFIAAALNLPAALQLSLSPFKGISAPLAAVLVDEAWAQPAIQSSPETTPAQQEETTQPPQGQGGPLPSAPSTTASEEQKKPAAEAPQPAGEKPSTPPPQEQGGPQAEQPQKQGPPPPEEQKTPAQAPASGAGPGAGTTIVDVLHGGISQTLLTTATWLDSFFGDRRYASDLNPSYVRFRYNVFLEKRSALLLKPDLEARLILPQLRKKTHIVISGSPREENEFSAVQSHTAADRSASTEDKGVTTGVQYAPRETATESFVVRGGLKFSTKGVDLTTGPLYRVQFPFQNGWKLRFIEDAVWRSRRVGWKYASTVDLERLLAHDLFFRASTDWVHTEHVNGFVYAYSFSITQPLSSKAALQYAWVNVFHTRPVNELTEVALRVSYRKRIWRDWLYYEVMPQYRFPRDRAFEATPGILFRLDMLFGRVTP